MHQQHAVAILTDCGCYPVVHFVTRRALFASVAVCRDYSENWLKVVAAAISLVAMISAATVATMVPYFASVLHCAACMDTDRIVLNIFLLLPSWL